VRPRNPIRDGSLGARMAKLSSSLTVGLAAAAAAGTAALVNRARARAAEAARPPAGRWVDADGVRLHVVARGDGPPLVLIHGMGALIDDFAESGLIDRAAAEYRTIAIDRPGYGYSTRPANRLWSPQAHADVIRAALRALGVERAIILGHSWGTMVALAFALDHPEATAGLVLLSGYYHPTARPDPLLLGMPALPVIGPLLAHTVSPLIGRAIRAAVYRQLFAPMPVPESFRRRFPAELALRPGHLQAAAGDAAQLQSGAAALAPRYPELTLPIAIVSGTGDAIVSHSDQSQRLAATLPQARLFAVAGAGHMIHWVAPDTVMAAIASVATAAAARTPLTP